MPAMASPPSILIVLTDQQFSGAMGCEGFPGLATPHMDRLAASGTRFDKAYCAAPVCGPSRASIATGRLPHEHGVVVNGLTPDPAMPNLGRRLRDAGYDTAWSGLWHQPNHGPPIDGFECLNPAGGGLGLGMHSDAGIVDRAIEYLQRDHDEPFCLGVAISNPHDICYWIMQQSQPAIRTPLTEKLKTGADRTDLSHPPRPHPPLPPNFARDPDEPPFVSDRRRNANYGPEQVFTHDWDQAKWREYRAAYAWFVEQADAQVGRLLDALDATGLRDETLILFSSDHGEGLAAHQWVVKLMLYEETARVPLIMAGPGIPHGQVARSLASSLDIVPTLCDYAGADGSRTTGISLRPAVEDASLALRDFVVTELHADQKDRSRQGRMLRTEGFKYIAFSHGQRPEMLFDLANDPHEMHDLARTHHAELPVLRRKLQRWCEQSGDDFTPACGWSLTCHRTHRGE